MEFSAEAAKAAANHDIMAFVRGQQDCRNGVAHSDIHGESYTAGYSFEYELSEILGARSGRKN